MKTIFNSTTTMALAVIMLFWLVACSVSCTTPQNITKSKYKVDLCPNWAPVAWEDDIHNPENREYVIETAFNLEISPDRVTQEQFNNRYN